MSKRSREPVTGSFRIGQDVVRSVEFDRLPGFSGLALHQALVTSVQRSVVGYNVAADLTWPLASHFGIGTVTRYSRARVDFDPGSESGVSRAIELYAGGLHVGVGIRLLF